MSPKSRGRPTPSTVRFAHRSTRGKPAQPAPLDAAPAPAAPSVVAMHDLTRFPAPAAWGAGATPPTASPPALGPAATRRRSATCRRLPCGSPRLPAVRLGRTHLQGLRAAVPWPQAMSFGLVVAPLSRSATAGDCAPMACHRHGTDFCQTVRVVAAGLPRRPASAQGRRLPPPESVAHSFGDHHPVRPGCKGRWHRVRSFIRPLRGCGFGSALAAWSAGLGIDFAKGDELRTYGGKQMLPHAKPEMA